MVTATKLRAGRPTRDDTRRKSERLLEAASELFATSGFDGTTMEAIARAAHMGKQAVYMRFPDKESVFTAVIDRLNAQEAAALVGIDETLPLKEALPVHIHAMLTAAARPAARLITHFAFREGHRFPAVIRILAEESEEHFIRPLARLIDKAVAEGEAREVNSLVAASTCVDLVMSEIMRAGLRQITLSPSRIEQRSAEIADFVLRGLLKRG
jgi:TetR/AcrR family transcriptional regulator, mexJK operon transcriptional repressor